MWKVLTLLAAFGLLAATSAGAQAPAAPPQVEVGTNRVDLPLGETTEIKGQLPVDLVGFWLVSEAHGIGGDKVFPGLQIYRLAKDPKGQLQVNLVDFKPPASVAAKLAAAQQAQKVFVPDKEDLTAITEALKANPPAPDPKRRGKHLVSSAKEFDPKLLDPEPSKGALFAIQSLFQPGDRPLYGQSYYILKASREELSGTVTLGSVPLTRQGVPMPIHTVGTFRWIRLDLPVPVAAPAPTPVAPTAAASTPTPAK